MKSSRTTPVSFDEIRAAVVRVASGMPEIAVLYAYGSRARGSQHPESDLDLALVLAEDAEPGPLYAETFSARVSEVLGSLTEVDAHLADHLPLPVLGRVVTEGVNLFERDASRRVEFETSTRRRYFDFLPFMERDLREALGG